MSRFGISVGVAVVGLVAVASPASGGVEGKWSKTFTVTAACGCNEAPLIASSARYGSTVAWVDTSSVSTGDPTANIWSRRIRRDGSLAPKRKLGSVVTFSSHPAAIAQGQSGAIVLAWQSGDQGMHARRISPRGKIGRLHRIASYAGRDIQVRVAVDARGNATIAWAGTWAISSQHSSPPDPTNVHVRRLSAKGDLGPTVGMPRDSAYHEQPSVAVAPSGRATVVWTESGGAIRASTIDPDGVVGPVRQVNPEPTYAWPHLAIGARGDATVVWHASYPSKVTVRRISAAGELGPVYVPAPGETTQGGGQIGLDSKGNALVTWGSQSPVPFQGVMQSWRLGADDSVGPVVPLSPPFVAPDLGDGAPLLVVDGEGNATLAWLRSLRHGDTVWFATLARRVAPDGTLGTVRTLADGSPSVSLPALAADQRGAVTAVWNTGIGGPDFSAIKATRFTPRR